MLFRSDRKSTRLNSSHTIISYAVFCLKKKTRPRSTGDVHTRHQREGRQLQSQCDNRGGEGANGRRHYFVGHPAGGLVFFFFFNDTATTEISALSLHDALPINDTATTEIYTLSLHDALRSRWSPYH